MTYINRRKNPSFIRNLRDYTVPIVGVLLVILLVFWVFKDSDSNAGSDNENQTGIEITLNSGAEATIIYPGGSEKDVEGNSTLYKGEKIKVKQGNVSVKADSIDFRVNKLGELKYNENGSFEVSSGDVWVNAYTSADINMNFAKLKISENSHLSLNQNEMSSSIYLISGLVEVSNLSKKSTVLAPGEQIGILRANASKDDIVLSAEKKPIDQFFIKSDWYILNSGDSFTSKPSDTNTGSNASSNSFSQILTFNNLIDFSHVSSSSINISGTYTNENISKISLNGKQAVLDSTAKTFKIENMSVPNYENDLVFKIYDSLDNIISKFVYTVYYEQGNNSSNSNNNSGGKFTTTTYDVDGTKFTFTAPSTGTSYTTSEDELIIRGKVLDKQITSVVVNDYTLSSYETVGGTWRYNARVILGNLAEGTNVYEIKYYSGQNLIYTNYFTIIKKPATTTVNNPTPPTTTEEPKNNNEENMKNGLF